MSIKTLVLAGGCFWGMEAYFKRFDGIVKTEVGYANGSTANPTYEEVCSHVTGHAEVLYLHYDPSLISLETILSHFWHVIDPTALNRQGGDVGTQYRTGIYYTDEADLETIQASLKDVQKQYQQPVVTEIMPLKAYYPAEEYHQKYLDKNPGGYCHIKLD